MKATLSMSKQYHLFLVMGCLITPPLQAGLIELPNQRSSNQTMVCEDALKSDSQIPQIILTSRPLPPQGPIQPSPPTAKLHIPRHIALGKLTKASPRELNYFKSMIFNLREESQFPSVGENELTELTRVETGGRGNKGTFTARFGEKTVFIKITDPKKRSEGQILNEARWLLFLNKVNLCPEFFGLVRTQQGDLGLVMEALSGEPLSESNLPSNNPLTQQTLNDISSNSKMLHDLGVSYTPDMQYMSDHQGRATLIDPEFYSWQVPLFPPLDPDLVPYHPIENGQRLIDLIQKHF
jgi:hypothetical protein